MKSNKNVRVFDSSWTLPAQKIDHNLANENSRIPGSIRFDIDAVADLSINLPHMLPPPSVFEEAASKMGISQDTHVVFYDTNPNYNASARAWWTFKVFGFDKVSVLEGGFEQWKASGFPVESGSDRPTITPVSTTLSHFAHQ